MKRWAPGLYVLLALILSAAGCGGGQAVVTPLAVTLSPTAVTALVGSFVQFALGVNATVDTVTFAVNDVTGGNGTVGTITTEGLYQAPAIVPANTTIAVTATASDSTAGTSASATATVTLDSGVRVSIVPATFTVGTDEQFQFATKVRVTGVPPGAVISGVCDNSSSPLCTALTWSVTSGGAIDASTGNFTAPSTVGTAATVTATSVYDTTRTATATVTLVTATDPTVSSISNTVGAMGAAHQDVYLTGSNFISTTQVRFNDGVSTSLVSDTTLVSSTVLRVRLADSDLKAAGTPTRTLTFTASRQGGAENACATPCQLVLSAQRPAVVGTSLDSFLQNSSPTLSVNGGYYGTNTDPTVSAQFGSQPPSGSVVSANQLDISLSGSDTSTPGLVPVTVTSNVPGATVPPAVINVAVQPSTAPVLIASPSVGAQPSSVAINTATGIAVVANQGSHSIALINLTGPTVVGFICTATQGATLFVIEPACPASGPTSVAVDNLRNLALVANSTTKTVAVVDLAAQSVREIIPSAATSLGPRTPWGVGINPLSGRAIVAYQSAGFASIIDLNRVPAAVIGLVAASTGPTPRVASSPRLNWALVTPGGGGSLAIVDLGRQNVNPISSAIRSGNVVTMTTSSPHTLRVNDPVLITGVTDGSFNGVFNVSGVSDKTFTYSQSGANVSSGGGTANYALPIATVATSLSTAGVGINDETQKAILVDPTGPQARIFNLLDQTSTTVPGLALIGNTAGAFNPLTNVAVTVNRINSDGAVIDPSTPALLPGTLSGLNLPVDVAIDPGTNQAVVVNSGGSPGSVSIFSLGGMRAPQVLQVSRQDSTSANPKPPEVEITSTLTSAAVPIDETLTIIGKGFTGASVVRLDGDSTGVQIIPPVSDRVIKVKVLASRLAAGGPRLYALDVVNGAVTSNAASFTVVQSVDVTSAGCPAPAPLGVAIDYSIRNKAVVTNPGCNSVSIIDLTTGTGSTVLVGINPQGVAVYLQSGYAVVANQGSNPASASIVDINAGTVVATVKTDPGPTGVAIDPGLGLAVVTASNANFLDTFAVSSSDGTVAASFAAVQARPVAVAIDPETHFAAVANTTSNSVSLVDLTQTVATEHIPANGLPAGIAFDPVTTTFLTAASLLNQVLVLDPVSRSTTGLRIGINPTSIAYNFASSTLVTTNSSSQTMSVMDFLSGRVRAVLSFKPSGRFAVDIHPFTNLAVIADSADNKVFLRPLPR